MVKSISDIRITDPVIIRLVEKEQRRLKDSSATKTAGRIIERYFAARDAVTTPDDVPEHRRSAATP